MLWFSLWDVYRYQPISHSSCRLSTMYGSICLVWLSWSCETEKIQTLFIFPCDMWKYSTCSMNNKPVRQTRLTPSGFIERALYFPISHWNEHCLHIIFFQFFFCTFAVALVKLCNVPMTECIHNNYYDWINYLSAHDCHSLKLTFI